MKTIDIPRNYSLIVAARDTSNLFAKTYDFYNKGAVFFFDFWVDLLGGVTADAVPEKVELKDKGTVKCEISREANCFSLWFTPQRNPHRHAVPAKDVRSRFEQYLGRTVTDPVLTHLFDTIEEDVDMIWVDRRKSFADLDITSADVNLLVGNKFPWSPDGDLSVFIRNLLSIWWGQGNKADWKSAVTTLETWQKNLSKFANIGDIFGVPSDRNTYEYVKTVLGNGGSKKTGRDSTFANHIKKVEGGEDLNKEILSKGIDEALKNARERVKQKPQAWTDNLRKQFESHIGIGYYDGPNGRNLLEEANEMWFMAAHRHRSWRSALILHLNERLKLYRDFTVTGGGVIDVIESHRKVGQRYFDMGQFRGIGILMERWSDPGSDPVAEVDSMKSDQIGDRNLIRAIAEYLKNNPEERDIKKLVEDFIECESAKRSYYTKRNPPLTPISRNNPAHPWFRGTRGSLNARDCRSHHDRKPKKNDEAVRAVVQVYDGTKIVDHTARFLGWRFVREIYGQPQQTVYVGTIGSGEKPLALKKRRDIPAGKMVKEPCHGSDRIKILVKNPVEEKPVPVSRDNSVNRLKYGEIVQPQFNEEIAFQIVPQGDRWYVNVLVKCQVPQTDRSNLKGETALGIDLGMRQQLAYSVARVDDGGEVLLDDHTRMKVANTGTICEEQKKTSNGVQKTFCRLSQTTDRPITEREIQVWDDLNVLSGYNWKDKPSSAARLNEDVARFAVKICKNLSDFSLAGDALKSAYGQIMCSRVGALTLQKLDTLMRLISAYCSLIRRMEDAGVDVPDSLRSDLLTLRSKLNQSRQERARISANLVIKKSIEVGAKVIFFENLTLGMESGNNRRWNKRLMNWCAKRVISLVEASANEYGYTVKKVYARGTSTEDFHSGVRKPKFRRHETGSLDSEWMQKKLENSLRHHSSERYKLVRECLRAKAEAHGLPTNLKGVTAALKLENRNGKVYIPDPHGDFYYSDLYGKWMDSDEIAAIHIAKRGFADLIRYERQGGETAGKKKNVRKPLSDKTLESANREEGLSRTLKWAAATTWG